jgi:hypothetical protein
LKSFQIGPWLVGEEGQGRFRPNSGEGEARGGGEGVVSEHQELKAHLLGVLGRGGDDRRWGSHGSQGGGTEELVGEGLPGEEGGQARV